MLDEASGQPTQIITAEPVPAPTAGTGTQTASHASMVKTRLLTGVFADGRQIRGGPFIGPIDGDSIRSNGDLDTNVGPLYVTALQTLADALPIHGSDLRVYRRPRPADPTATPPVTARPGQSAVANSFDVFPRPGVLRSRRD